MRTIFVTNILNLDDGDAVVYTTAAVTKELAEADCLEAIRSWGSPDDPYALPGEEGSVFSLDTQELNLIED
jgi:hypothetical protein